MNKFEEIENKIKELANEIERLKNEQEEAEFRAEQLKVEAELRRFARPFVVGEHNYTLNFDHRTNCIGTFSPSYTQEGNIHFDSEKIALETIDTVGEDRIKKYYFMVEE